MFSWLIVMPMTRVSAKVSIRAISLAAVGIGIIGKSPSTVALRRVLHDHAGGPAAAQDVGRRQVGGVAERALALDDDHVGVLALERRDHRCLDLARAELAGRGVQGDAVLAALDERGLAGADHARP